MNSQSRLLVFLYPHFPGKKLFLLIIILLYCSSIKQFSIPDIANYRNKMNIYFLQIILFIFLCFPQEIIGQSVLSKPSEGEIPENNRSSFIADNTALFEKYRIDQLNAQIEYERLNSKRLEQELIEKKDQLVAVRASKKKIQQNYFLAFLGFCLFVVLIGVIRDRNIRRNFIEKEETAKLQFEKQMIVEKARLTLETIENERERIARNLHDGISNDLVSLRLQLQSMGNAVQGKELLVSLAENTHREVRAIMHNLSSPAIDKLGFEHLFYNHIEIMNCKETLKVEGTLLPKNGWDKINCQTRTHIYRLLQEITGNMMKHSEATKVNITLRRDDDGIIILAEDNGIGISNVGIRYGFGMRNLETRVSQLKGQLQVETAPNEGTIIRVQLPLYVA